jgi:4,5-dihydroxyphthalate decarboxylase
MSDLDLAVGCMDYEHTRALADGTVRFDGVDATFRSAGIVTEIFEGALARREFDVAELGLTYYLRTLDLDDPHYIALPVFPNRQFRHSAIYVNTASGITAPGDLAGRTVGEFALYGHDGGFWPKGILSDEFGVRPEQCRWVIGGFDRPMPPLDFVPQPHPDGTEVTRAPDGAALGPMLDAGEIDAFISADAPRCFLDGSPRVAQLFADPVATERDYFRRTGIFPIMHVIVVRRELLAGHPGLAAALYAGFRAAKDVTVERYRAGRPFNHMTVMTPWVSELYDENRALLGEDWWPYGIAANRTALDTALRYHAEQGLTRRRFTCEEVFAGELLGT